MEPREGACGREATCVGKCAIETFYLESDQSLPMELAKHDPLDRLEVFVGVCIALRDLVHPFSSKVASLELEGGGQGVWNSSKLGSP